MHSLWRAHRVRMVVLASASMTLGVIAWRMWWHRRPALLVLWTDTRAGGALRVQLDGRERGTLTRFFVRDAPTCAPGTGVLAVRVPSGRHTLSARDERGRRWTAHVDLDGGECRLVRLGPAMPPTVDALDVESPNGTNVP